jgi:rhodanese-related sulfurtransferase
MLAVLSRLFRKAPMEPRWIGIGELRAQLDGRNAPLVIDVRGRDEFDGPLGHIEGALNIPLPEFAAHRDQIAGAGRPVVFVCLSDKRSAAAAAELASAGRADALVLRGGMKAWRGMP